MPRRQILNSLTGELGDLDSIAGALAAPGDHLEVAVPDARLAAPWLPIQPPVRKEFFSARRMPLFAQAPGIPRRELYILRNELSCHWRTLAKVPQPVRRIAFFPSLDCTRRCDILIFGLSI